jgi:primase-polymerase (primpol)-like protein
MSYRKAEYLVNEVINRIKTKAIPRLNTNLCIISKVFSQKNLEKDKRQKIMDKIKQFMVGEEKISIYNSQSSDFENIMKDFNKEKLKIRTQKVEMRVYQLTEEAKNTQNNNLKNKKKDCIIY